MLPIALRVILINVAAVPVIVPGESILDSNQLDAAAVTRVMTSIGVRRISHSFAHEVAAVEFAEVADDFVLRASLV